jgi:hypothetical protein
MPCDVKTAINSPDDRVEWPMVQTRMTEASVQGPGLRSLASRAAAF